MVREDSCIVFRDVHELACGCQCPSLGRVDFWEERFYNIVGDGFLMKLYCPSLHLC